MKENKKISKTIQKSTYKNKNFQFEKKFFNGIFLENKSILKKIVNFSTIFIRFKLL